MSEYFEQEQLEQAVKQATADIDALIGNHKPYCTHLWVDGYAELAACSQDLSCVQDIVDSFRFIDSNFSHETTLAVYEAARDFWVGTLDPCWIALTVEAGMEPCALGDMEESGWPWLACEKDNPDQISTLVVYTVLDEGERHDFFTNLSHPGDDGAEILSCGRYLAQKHEKPLSEVLRCMHKDLTYTPGLLYEDSVVHELTPEQAKVLCRNLEKNSALCARILADTDTGHVLTQTNNLWLERKQILEREAASQAMTGWGSL